MLHSFYLCMLSYTWWNLYVCYATLSLMCCHNICMSVLALYLLLFLCLSILSASLHFLVDVEMPFKLACYFIWCRHCSLGINCILAIEGYLLLSMIIFLWFCLYLLYCWIFGMHTECVHDFIHMIALLRSVLKFSNRIVCVDTPFKCSI